MIKKEYCNLPVSFKCSRKTLEKTFYKALRGIQNLIRIPKGSKKPVLYEGDPYLGCWLESTGSISAEVLSRFMPEAARNTFEIFADCQQQDGLYPVTVRDTQGPVYSQLQTVSPIARGVWNFYSMYGNRKFLEKMYSSMAGFDRWIETHRNTRGTGCAEAFCTWDTGHDNSSRFWHAENLPPRNDPRAFRKSSPFLPYLAPDLTAFVFAQRHYLAMIASELGENSGMWIEKKVQTEKSLWENCFCREDDIFYDVDRWGNFVTVQSDVLLRVLACGIGDDGFFQRVLKKYLLNTRKFFARFPLTSVALDDPRFDRNSRSNSWGGPTNLLTLIRAFHPFEQHGHLTELSWILQPVLGAIGKTGVFGQTLDPWTGAAGVSAEYTPAMLFYIDGIERLCGIMPLPGGRIRFSGLLPVSVSGSGGEESSVYYSRRISGTLYEQTIDGPVLSVNADGKKLFEAPAGIRVETDVQGGIRSVTGMCAGTVTGQLKTRGKNVSFSVRGNQILVLQGDSLVPGGGPPLIPPVW
ncbi:MAG: MGH1-like glycoside hydrolase domain-containing protein [Spirochaetia bacterium]